MNRIIKVILIIIIVGIAYKWLDYKDYYKTNYLEITKKEQKLFAWESNYDNYLDHRKAYQKYFGSKEFIFPRQEVSKITMLEKDKLFKTVWVSKTLKNNYIDRIVTLFNEPNNFGWGETSWGEEDIDYIFKFYDKENTVIGKVEICYHDCGMTKSKPFSPNMKYGQLSATGKEKLFLIIYKLNCWK